MKKKKWQDIYLCPQIERKRISFELIKKEIKKYWILIIHSLSPHEYPNEPNKDLPDIKSDDDALYDVSLAIYNKANDRIEQIENKAFKLLQYITALFAIFAFVFVQLANSFIFKIILSISLVLLIFSLLISFRCLNIKTIKTLFIPDIFDVESEEIREKFNKKLIIKNYLKCSIYNHNVADNIVDMLNATRFILVSAVIVGLIGSGIILLIQYSNPKLNNIANKSTNTLLIDMNKTQNSVRLTKKEIELIEQDPNIKFEIKKIFNQIDTLKINLNTVQVNYDSLNKKIEIINKELNLIINKISFEKSKNINCIKK